ncbi:MAG: hypothetical protein LC793_16210 [Thermomicrobia bacterium]|nr:hypothetical protein [Thermomicrobia bacterium]MCA1725134.1 hypothetical protein [Thermomicrobia bacterium]
MSFYAQLARIEATVVEIRDLLRARPLPPVPSEEPTTMGATVAAGMMGAMPSAEPSPLMTMLSAPLPGKAGPDSLYPDPVLTPGATNSAVTQATIATTIAVPGYTASIRPPVSVTSKIKAMIMARDGLTDPPSSYELDHAISLELGGSPDAIANLWCEHYADATHDVGAKQKDRVENWLHQQIVAGNMSLLEAQTAIMQDWYKIYLSLNKMGMLPMMMSYDPDGSSDPDDNA